MLETLAGRVKWERTEGGIRVEFRMRGDYAAMWRYMRASLRINFPAFLVVAAMFFSVHLFDHHGHIRNWWEDLLCMLFGALLGRFLSVFAGRTVLTLDATELKLEFLWWDWRRGREIYSTAGLHDLRFAEWKRGTDSRNGLRLAEIQFENYLAPKYFATGITEGEATAFISKMMEAYPFPRYTKTQGPGEASEERIHA